MINVKSMSFLPKEAGICNGEHLPIHACQSIEIFYVQLFPTEQTSKSEAPKNTYLNSQVDISPHGAMLKPPE